MRSPPRPDPYAAVYVVGNILEWFDFAVFGALADVMGDVFFPDSMNDKVGHPTCHPPYTHHTLTHDVWVPHSVAPCDL